MGLRPKTWIQSVGSAHHKIKFTQTSSGRGLEPIGKTTRIVNSSMLIEQYHLGTIRSLSTNPGRLLNGQSSGIQFATMANRRCAADSFKTGESLQSLFINGNTLPNVCFFLRAYTNESDVLHRKASCCDQAHKQKRPTLR